MRADTLLLGVIYKGCEKYLCKYKESIEYQDTDDFDVLILNDGCKKAFYIDNRRTFIIDVRESLTSAEIRMLGIKYALENKYRYIIFSDADDYFSSNRISLSRNKLLKFDFVYNEMHIVYENKILRENFCSNYLKIKEKYDSYLVLIDKNIFGLSNTAVRTEALKKLYIPKNIIAVDWWVFSILLLNGHKGGFVRSAITFYRQYDNNIIGANKFLNTDVLNLGLKVKENHYRYLVDYCRQNSFDEAAKLYHHKHTEIIRLAEEISNVDFRKKYMTIINVNYDKIYKGWWSDILPLSEWRKYDE